MAYMVCQHCQEAVLPDETFAAHERFSYHTKCYKCYVCSETNLQNAEFFKGVIFCLSCSQRIFRGCSTARKTKGFKDKRARWILRHQHKERACMQERCSYPTKAPIPSGIIELARRAALTDSDKNINKDSKTPAITTGLALNVQKYICENDFYGNYKDLKKGSVETGMTTEVTEQLLRQMNCPVVENRKHGVKTITPESAYVRCRTRYLAKRGKYKYENNVSDMRIAELGASTEIANMALRKHSEVPIFINSTEVANVSLRKQSGTPVVIKSGSHIKKSTDHESLDLSVLNQESETSGDYYEEWPESSSSMNESVRKFWTDRRFYSLLKVPYKCFKSNILKRSSLINFVTTNNHGRNVFKVLKIKFNESTTKHQDRGLKRLYSTINRRKVPYKMGWLNLMVKVSRIISQQRMPKTCKHFNRSHSYRCMRSQVMKRAGPTKSELALFRMKIKNIFTPSFIKNLLNFSKSSSMISAACGSEPLSAK